MEKPTGDYLPNKETEQVKDIIETGPDVQQAVDKLEGLAIQFESLLEKFGWEDSALMAIAFREALANAVFHGNYGVVKVNGIPLHILAKQKMDEGVNIPAEVKVSFNVSNHTVEVVVEDMGEGFDRKAVPNPESPEYLLKDSGKGINLMEKIFQEVNFGGRRNNIVIMKSQK